MGGGITGSKGNPGSNEALEQQSTDYFNLVKPLLEQSTSGVSDILKTGGTNAEIPSIQRSVEASNQATAQARQRTSEDLVRQGITGTDYNTIISQLLQQGEFNTSQIPGNFYQDILSTFYKSLSGAPQVSLSGLGTAASNETQTNIANVKAAQEFIGKIQDAAAKSIPAGT